MDSNLKEQIESLRKQVIKRNELRRKEGEENEKNFNKLQSLLLKYIFEGDLLLQSAWEFSDFTLSSNAENFPKLAEIMREISDDESWGYHFGITLKNLPKNRDIELRFDDGELSIYALGDDKKLIDFIKDNKLKITMKGIDGRIKRMTEKLDVLQKMKEHIKGQI